MSVRDLNIEAVEFLLAQAPGVDQGRARDAAAVLRGESGGFFDPVAYQSARVSLQESWQGATRRFWPTVVSLDGHFGGRFRLARVGDVLRIARDASANPYMEFVRSCFTPSIPSRGKLIVGLSVISLDQVLGAATVAAEVRRKRPDALIVVGGPAIGERALTLRGDWPLFELFDVVVQGEGEEALTEIVERFSRGRSLSGMNGAAARGNGWVVSGSSLVSRRFDPPLPAYNDLPLDRYFSPDPVLSVELARGCYWGRCAFCTTEVDVPRYRARPTDQVVSDIARLQRTTGSSAFAVCTESASAAQLLGLSEGILREDLDVVYYAGVRGDSRFRESTLERMYDAGCRRLLVGFESGSDVVLDRMRKGTSADNYRAFVRAATRSGIALHVYLMVGFPGERLADLEATSDLMADLRSDLDYPGFTYHISEFQLLRGTTVERCPRDYGIRRITAFEEDLDYAVEYDVSEGIRAGETRVLSQWLRERMEQLFPRSVRLPAAHQVLLSIGPSELASPSLSHSSSETSLGMSGRNPSVTSPQHERRAPTLVCRTPRQPDGSAPCRAPAQPRSPRAPRSPTLCGADIAPAQSREPSDVVRPDEHVQECRCASEGRRPS